MSIQSKLGAGVISLCALYTPCTMADVTGDPVVTATRIDVTTQGHWVGKYGSCYSVLPQASPRHCVPEIPIGPDFESTHPGQYVNIVPIPENCGPIEFPDALCISGEAPTNFDVRVFVNNPLEGEDGHAFAWGFDDYDCVPTATDPCTFKVAENAAQYNRCLSSLENDVYYPSTFDSDDFLRDPLSGEILIKKGGSATIAYYFLTEAEGCRSQSYELFVNNVSVASGKVTDFTSGKYVVFDIENIPDNALVRLDTEKLASDDSDRCMPDVAPNSHLSGIFVDGTDACAVPEVAGCRFTGGLNDVFEGNKYSAGGQVGANTGQQPQPKGEWTHRQRRGPAGKFTFHGGTASSPIGSEIDVIRCSDPGGCKPSGDPPSPVKQLDFDGIGTFKNIGKKGADIPDFMETAHVDVGHGNENFDGTLHWFEVNIDDLGEPGNTNPVKNPGDADAELCPATGFGEKGEQALAECSCSDFYRITIYDGVDATTVPRNADGSIDKANMNTKDVIYEVYGYIDGGNLQLHHPTGFDLK
jgi:hypothetical protein